MTEGPYSIPDGFEDWAPEAKERWLLYLKEEQYRLGVKERPWRKLARNKQLPPDNAKHRLPWTHPQTGEQFTCQDPNCLAGNVHTNWSTWIWLAARGTGKTFVGANWVLEMALDNPGVEVGVCGPTYTHVRKTCIEGTKSGILTQARLGGFPVDEFYNRTTQEIRLPNGSVIRGMSAEKQDSPRGFNLSFCWFDELCQVENERFYHDGLMPALREDDAKLLITTTPNRTKIIRGLVDDAEKHPDYQIHITGAPTRENPYFAPLRRQMLENQYMGTTLYKQELEGILLADVAGALFTLDRINASRLRYEDAPKDEFYRKVVVAIDPANTSNERSDETGIVAVAEGGNGHAYLLADRSMKGTPEQCMRTAVAAFKEFHADVMVCEKNTAGDYLDEALRHVDAGIVLKKVHAMKGKALRAQPVSMLMEQGRIHHVGAPADFDKLEEQLCSVTVDGDRNSLHDDRADAYVYAVTELTGLSEVSWLEAYGQMYCPECKTVMRSTAKNCPNCTFVKEPAPEIEVVPKKQEAVRSWAAAYQDVCRDCGNRYNHHLKKCPECHPDHNSVIGAAQLYANQTPSLRTRGLGSIWKRGI